MAFITKLDYSNNRQIKQRLETITTLSGGTIFGTTFDNLTKGPNLATSGETENYTLIASSFSGNNTTTVYNWYDPRMQLGITSLSALTPANSAETQTVLPIFAPSSSTIIDGNLVNTAFTGVTFDVTNIVMTDLGGGNYVGTVEHEFFDVLSASTAEYTGRTIWVDVSGITRTDRLIVGNNPQVGYVLTCENAEGMASWAPSGGSSGSTSYWSAGTGADAITTLNSSNVASGIKSLAQGNNTQANGFASHAEGNATIANGSSSHAEGNNTIASGNSSHAEGIYTKAIGDGSHAEGVFTIASGDSSHAEGYYSRALGLGSHAGGGSYTFGFSGGTAIGDGSFVHGENSYSIGKNTIVLGREITGNTADTTYVDRLNIKTVPIGTPVNNLGIDSNGRVVIGTTGGSGSTTSYWSAGTGSNAITTLNSANIASGNYSIAMGENTSASGYASHAEGQGTLAIGNLGSHAEGYNTIASGQSSHAEGGTTSANAPYSHAEGSNTQTNGWYSHAEGNATRTFGDSSHAGGFSTIANGTNSFVHGSASTVNGINSIVLGSGITGNTDNTTYVDRLNIKTVLAGPGTTDIGVDVNGNVVNQASDLRLKENINRIENALDKVMKLRGVTYNWKDRVNGGDNIRVGFIAQEVEEVIPELVTQNGDYLGVQYKDVPALLVEAIKELVSGNTEYSKTYFETQTIFAEDNNIELNYNGTTETAIGGGMTILRGDKEATTFITDENGDLVSNVNILSKGFIIPEYTPINSQDSYGVVGNVVQDENYIYVKGKNGWKRTPKLEDF